MSAEPAAHITTPAKYPLSGITVIDLSHIYNGP